MAKQKQTTHKPFSKPFYKLLGSCVLGLALVYGGIVWASFSIGTGSNSCAIVDSSNRVTDIICRKLGKSGTTDAEREITIPANRAEVGVKGYAANEIGKTLQFTNQGGQEVFIPARSKAELLSVLQAKKSGNAVLSGIDICSKSGAFDFGGENVKACAAYAWHSSDWGTCTTATQSECSGVYPCPSPIFTGSHVVLGGWLKSQRDGSYNSTSPITIRIRVGLSQLTDKYFSTTKIKDFDNSNPGTTLDCEGIYGTADHSLTATQMVVKNTYAADGQEYIISYIPDNSVNPADFGLSGQAIKILSIEPYDTNSTKIGVMFDAHVKSCNSIPQSSCNNQSGCTWVNAGESKRHRIVSCKNTSTQQTQTDETLCTGTRPATSEDCANQYAWCVTSNSNVNGVCNGTPSNPNYKKIAWDVNDLGWNSFSMYKPDKISLAYCGNIPTLNQILSNECITDTNIDSYTGIVYITDAPNNYVAGNETIKWKSFTISNGKVTSHPTDTNAPVYISNSSAVNCESIDNQDSCYANSCNWTPAPVTSLVAGCPNLSCRAKSRHHILLST